MMGNDLNEKIINSTNSNNHDKSTQDKKEGQEGLTPLTFERVGMLGTKASKSVSFKYQIPYDTCQSDIVNIWKENESEIKSFINSQDKEREKNLYLYFFNKLRKLHHIKEVTTKDTSLWKYKTTILVEYDKIPDINDLKDSLLVEFGMYYFDLKTVKINKVEGENKYSIFISGMLNKVYCGISTDNFEDIAYKTFTKACNESSFDLKIKEIKIGINKKIMFSPYMTFELNKLDWNDEEIYEIYDRKELFSLNRHLFELTKDEDLVVDLIFSGYNPNNNLDAEVMLEALREIKSSVNSQIYLRGAFMDRLVYKLRHNSPFRDDL